MDARKLGPLGPSFLASMDQGANVFETQEILRLSCTHHLKPVHFISSLSVLEGVQEDLVSEDVNIEKNKNLSNGYAESKWVSEKLVLIARKRGIPCNIFRLPRVGGDSRIGSGPTEDFLWRFVRAALVLQKAPQINLYDDLTPVDYICKAIHFISTKPKWINSQFHVISPYPLPYSQIFQFLQKRGYHLEWTDETTWKKALLAQAAKTNDPNLQALAALFTETEDIKPISHHFASDHLQSALKKSHIQCPKMDKKLLTKYVDFYVRTHFFPTPDYAHQTTA